VNTKGAAELKSTLTAVIEARAKATSVTIDPTNISPEQLAQFNQAQSGVSSLCPDYWLVERYPELKSKPKLKLQDELASTENQILQPERVLTNSKPQQSYQNFPN
jgi:LemA protein